MAEIHSQPPAERSSHASRAMRQAVCDTLGFCAEHPDAAADADADAGATISPERKPVTRKPWPDERVKLADAAPWCPEYTGLYVTNLM